MSKMKFLDPKEAEKFKNKSGKCFVGHPVVSVPVSMPVSVPASVPSLVPLSVPVSVSVA